MSLEGERVSDYDGDGKESETRSVLGVRLSDCGVMEDMTNMMGLR